ncbi:MAG: hypothetical protein A2Y25_01815 [Candidatus Melainabacteria bacterium GWF2_37_15]|nr:MAG: hypothetical protein A2Y25_01815 [Candidatus Melainabacteria bacterium GWF2_37_15]
MTTIQGSISKLVDNSNNSFQSLGYVSSNMANWNTTSYKGQRFETFMGPENVLSGVVRIDTSPGSNLATFRQLDVALEGTGYIPITNEKGEILYTRDGSFAVNSDGYIVSKHNALVGGGIKLPANYERIKISTDGTVNIQKEKYAPFETIGKIPVVVFQNPEGLEIAEGNTVKETEGSGKPELLLGHAKIRQGMLERGNVDGYALVNETIKLNGSIISSTRVIKILDEIYKESINLRQ